MSAFLEFANICDALASTTKKLEKRALIADWLKSLSVEDAVRGALYLAGQPFAETDPRVLNLGGAILSKALAQVSGANEAAMHATYRRHGDLGAASEELLAAQAKAPVWTLEAVEKKFAEIAAAKGQAVKLALVVQLLHSATPIEAKYLIKLALGDMRTGVKQSLVEEAIAAAFNADPSAVRRATMLKGSLPEVVRFAAAGKLDQARMSLFHPLGFMLASPVDSVEEALARFAQEVAAEHAGVSDASPTGNVVSPEELKPSPDLAVSGAAKAVPLHETVDRVLKEAHIEDKYDGIRAQLHCGDPAQPGRVALFSRSREDMTAAFPELAEAFSSLNQPVILDGEVLAWDFAGQRALAFSSLQRRIGRKRVTDEMREQTPVVFIAFDVLSFDGELMLERPLAERRAALEEFARRVALKLTAGFREIKPVG